MHGLAAVAGVEVHLAAAGLARRADEERDPDVRFLLREAAGSRSSPGAPDGNGQASPRCISRI
jgi:hypothetical protein